MELRVELRLGAGTVVRAGVEAGAGTKAGGWD